MTVEQMLTKLQANYETLETQFKQTDLSAIPPAKLVELMLRHVTAIQKGMQLLAKPSDPAPPVPGAQNPPSAKPSSPPTPSAAPIPAPQSKIQNLKSKIPSPASDPAQDGLDRLHERNEAQSADLLRRLGLQPPAPAPKEPPHNPYRPKITVPPRSPTR